MPFIEDLKNLLEQEEYKTVGTAFGGSRRIEHKSFSVANIKNWIIEQSPCDGPTEVEQSLQEIFMLLPQNLFSLIIGNLIRFSFLIELTNLKLGSTKMKTRWLPGQILMPQANSFEPIIGSFEPCNDPRATTYEECLSIFLCLCRLVKEKYEDDTSMGTFLLNMNKYRRIPYEFPVSYIDPTLIPVHKASNR